MLEQVARSGLVGWAAGLRFMMSRFHFLWLTFGGYVLLIRIKLWQSMWSSDQISE